MDDNQFFLGHQIFVGITAETFDTQMLYYYYVLFLAKRFILILNHPCGDATPTKADVKLLKSLEADSHVLSFKPFFADFIVIGKGKYFSMATNNGTACRCRQQNFEI